MIIGEMLCEWPKHLHCIYVHINIFHQLIDSRTESFGMVLLCTMFICFSSIGKSDSTQHRISLNNVCLTRAFGIVKTPCVYITNYLHIIRIDTHTHTIDLCMNKSGTVNLRWPLILFPEYRPFDLVLFIVNIKNGCLTNSSI